MYESAARFFDQSHRRESVIYATLSERFRPDGGAPLTNSGISGSSNSSSWWRRRELNRSIITHRVGSPIDGTPTSAVLARLIDTSPYSIDGTDRLLFPRGPSCISKPLNYYYQRIPVVQYKHNDIVHFIIILWVSTSRLVCSVAGVRTVFHVDSSVVTH